MANIVRFLKKNETAISNIKVSLNFKQRMMILHTAIINPHEGFNKYFSIWHLWQFHVLLLLKMRFDEDKLAGRHTQNLEVITYLLS